MAIWAKKKYLKLAKGFRGRAKNCPRVMMPKVEKSLQKAFKDRRRRPRDYKRQWISTINGGCREHGVSYSSFVFGLNRSNITLNRKILANLAINEPYTFKAVVDEIKAQKSLRLLHKDDMEFIEAVDRTFLVYGEVKELPEMSDKRIPFILPRDDLPEELKAKIKII